MLVIASQTVQGVDNKYSKFGCGKYFPIALLTVDHIIPIYLKRKKNPVFDIGNPGLLCWECHRKKTTENEHDRCIISKIGRVKPVPVLICLVLVA